MNKLTNVRFRTAMTHTGPTMNHMGRACLLLAMLLNMLFLRPALSVAAATTFTYPDFSSTSGLTLVGAAARSGTVLRVVPSLPNRAGAAWTSSKQPVQCGFETTFDFRMSSQQNGGADGLAFVVQNAGGSVIGLTGEGIGYAGIPNSLAVEFDTWLNNPANAHEPNDNHISIRSQGTSPNSSLSIPSLGTVGTGLPAFSIDGAAHTAKIVYTPGAPGTMGVYLDGTLRVTVSVNLATLLSLDNGSAYVGFTAATGFATENEDILNWSYADHCDTTAPIANPTQAPAPNGAGWNSSDVTITWNWMDEANGSGIDPANCTMSSVASVDGNPIALNAICKDLAGNLGSASYTLKLDKTKPMIIGSHSPAANANGWNNTDVTVSFTCEDALSGLAAGSPPADTILSGEGANLSVIGTCSDIAENSATNTQSEIKIDKTKPSTSLIGPTDWTNVDVTLTLDPHDALSGVSVTSFILDGGQEQTGTTIAISDEGIHSIEYWSVDNAGNVEEHHTAEVKIDKTAPTITHTQEPAANANGWNNGDVTVTFICGDNLSGLASCTDDQLVTTEGQAQPVVGTAADNAGNSASDTAMVSIDRTPPTIEASASASPNVNGWYNGDVFVLFTCEDFLSGIAICADGQILSEGANQNVSGTAIDAADNSADAPLNGINVDETPPTLTGAATPAANGYGWYKGDVTVTWTCSDDLSGLDGDCPADSLISGEGNTLSANASVSDLAGNTTNTTYSVQIDRTAPSIAITAIKADNTPYAAGTWTNQTVTVHFECDDKLSGVASCPADLAYDADGITPLASGTVTDKAGNSESASFGPIQIDKTGPTLNPVVTPSNISLNGTATVTSGAADALSGLASESCGTLDTSSFGAKTVTCTATDNAGNTSSADASYNVVWNFTGFFQPVDNLPTWNSVKAGLGVPIKFSLGGNQGLNIFFTGYPKSQVISCNSTAPVDGVEETVTAGSSSLSYDPATDQYIYVWKTDRAWAGTCRALVLKLADGSTHQANFKFTR